MADNTFNFDLDAPAVPTLTLDPVEAPAAEEKQPEPAAAPEAEQVKLSPEEQATLRMTEGPASCVSRENLAEFIAWNK